MMMFACWRVTFLSHAPSVETKVSSVVEIMSAPRLLI